MQRIGLVARVSGAKTTNGWSFVPEGCREDGRNRDYAIDTSSTKAMMESRGLID